MEERKIIEENDKKYIVTPFRSVAKVMGLVPEGEGTKYYKIPVVKDYEREAANEKAKNHLSMEIIAVQKQKNHRLESLLIISTLLNAALAVIMFMKQF